jgi:phosphoglycolate phosphatase-like HAD superfamily hydrolase
MTKTIIWDLDGTILDSLGLLEGGLAEVAPQYGFAVPSRQLLEINFHGTLEDTIDSVFGGLEPGILHDVTRAFLATQDKNYEVIEPHLFLDALRLATRAHEAGMRQILVTNRAHEGRLRASPRNIVANSDLSKYIDAVVCGDDSEHRKPTPEVLGALAAELKGNEVIIVGDQHVDAEFARNLDARAILVCRNGELPHHMDTLGDWQSFVTIVRSLEEVHL